MIPILSIVPAQGAVSFCLHLSFLNCLKSKVYSNVSYSYCLKSRTPGSCGILCSKYHSNLFFRLFSKNHRNLFFRLFLGSQPKPSLSCNGLTTGSRVQLVVEFCSTTQAGFVAILHGRTSAVKQACRFL